MDDIKDYIKITSGMITISHFNGVSEVGGIYREQALNGYWRLKIKNIQNLEGYDYFEAVHTEYIDKNGEFIGEWKLHDKKIAIPNNIMVMCDSNALGGDLNEGDFWHWQPHDRIEIEKMPENRHLIWMYFKWKSGSTPKVGFVLPVSMSSELKYNLHVGIYENNIIAVKVCFF